MESGMIVIQLFKYLSTMVVRARQTLRWHWKVVIFEAFF